jgi:hypothetical protein
VVVAAVVGASSVGTIEGTSAAAHIMAYVANTLTRISTNSCFATTVASIAMFLSKRCSGSPPTTSPPDIGVPESTGQASKIIHSPMPARASRPSAGAQSPADWADAGRHRCHWGTGLPGGWDRPETVFAAGPGTIREMLLA